MGYPKIWTSIMGEKWWKLASGVQRGCYLQLLLLCKDGADNGHLCYKNVMELSVLFSIDRRTTYKVLTFLSQKGCINIEHEDSGMVNIFIPKYEFYQKLDAKSHAKHQASKRAKPPPKSGLLNQTRLDQTRPEEGTPVFSKPKEEWEQNLSPIQQDFVKWEEAEFEMTVLPRMASFYGGMKDLQKLPGWRGGVAFVRDYEQELRDKVMTNPDYFKDHKPWKDELTRFIKTGIEAGRLGNAGMKGMSAVDERTHDAKKGTHRQTSSFGNGPGVKT